MKIMYFLLLILISIIICENPFEWTDPVSGTKYDYTLLKRDPNDPWKVKDGADNGLFSMIYYFSFGMNHNKKCKNQNIAVSEVLEVLKQPTDTCEILGRTETRTVALLDPTDSKKGISITYGGGDKCTNGDNPMQNGKPRQTKFNIYCSDKQDEFVVDLPGGTQGTTKCVLEFKIHSPAGCPGGSFGSGRATSMLFWLILILTLYFLLGYIYNFKQNNLSGKEALPNIEFWRTFPGLVQDGLAYSLQKLNQGVAYVKSKASGNNSAYNDL